MNGEELLAEVASKSDWVRVFVDHVGPAVTYEVIARARTTSRDPGPSASGRGPSLEAACRVALMQIDPAR